MSFFAGSFTSNSTTGNRSLTGFGFQPSYLRVTIGQKTGVSEAFVHLSQGWTDGTNSGCETIFWDSMGGKTVQFTDRIANHVNRMAGTLTDVITMTFVSFDADGVTVNLGATTSGYKIHLEAFA